MTARSLPEAAAPLFSHVTADKAATYRAIMDVFAAAKRQFRLHLRPDEVRAEAHWPDQAPSEESVQAALDQLTEWGNLQAQVDTSRVATLEVGPLDRHAFGLFLNLLGEALTATSRMRCTSRRNGARRKRSRQPRGLKGNESSYVKSVEM
jgi:hypothetical protein